MIGRYLVVQSVKFPKPETFRAKELYIPNIGNNYPLEYFRTSILVAIYCKYLPSRLLLDHCIICIYAHVLYFFVCLDLSELIFLVHA